MSSELNREKKKVSLVANLLVDSAWTYEAFFQLLNGCYARRPEEAEQLAYQLVSRFRSPVSFNTLFEYLSANATGLRLSRLSLRQLQKKKMALSTAANVMRSGIYSCAFWKVPPINSTFQLAEDLELPQRLLPWLSANYGNHYLIKAFKKRSGCVRVLEIPKAILKRTQQRILRDILRWIPAHPAAHGFVTGRSALTFVQPHLNQPLLLRMDLQDFFPSIDANRVLGLFRSLGYPYPVTQLLTGLCTTWSSPSKLHQAIPCISGQIRHQLASLYNRRHLPQGAPTSPALANLIAYRLDCRLDGLARSIGLTYTRYADDLLFSGGSKSASCVKSIVTQVGAIVLDEGFQLNYRKTRCMHRSVRQSAAGIVINELPNVRRVDFDRLKAILHNCIRRGAISQNVDDHPNFRAHLLGRINWVAQLNWQRGEKLRTLFDKIDWG